MEWDLKPIIFVLGLSGVGKTTTSDEMGKMHALLHIDMDHDNPFERIGLPNEWDMDIRKVDFVRLAEKFGSDGWNRTNDLGVMNPTL
jgi:phosphoribulokinase